MKKLTGPDTKVVDLKGRMVMPGLIDTHIHAVRGALTALGVVFRSDCFGRRDQGSGQEVHGRQKAQKGRLGGGRQVGR